MNLREGAAEIARWARANPGPTMTITTFLLLTLAVLATAYRGEQTRETVVNVERTFTRSACQIEPPSVYRRFTRCAELDRKREKAKNEEQTGTTSSDGATGEPAAAPDRGDAGDAGDVDGAGDAPDSPPDPPSPPPGGGGSPPGSGPDPPASEPEGPSPSLGDQIGDTVDHVTGLGCQITTPLGVCIR